MRVKRLEVQGFKSFKDKTVIHFDHSITGIVGPNGCGKSNIVDAFFWVMGEQSYKHMRGSGSDDLIFNGSSNFDPAGIAEASLVLETDAVDTANTAAGASSEDLPAHLKYKEVAITRRVYRGGEGEYFINGVQCRLKDIHEFFMDTGVGRKGYSIIEQGQIGKIVNAKPEERRVLIEEAAGIAKYKARKKETLRKMEATEGNLSRLNDVVQEIERTLASLDRQATKARKYNEYKEQLFEKETTWARRRHKILKKKVVELKEEKTRLEDEITEARNQLNQSENEIEVLRAAEVTLTKEAEDTQSRVHEIGNQITQEQGALELSKKRQEDLFSQISNMGEEKTQLTELIDSGKETLETRKNELESIRSEFDQLLSSVSEKSSSVDQFREATSSERKEIEEIKSRLLNEVAESSELKSRSAAIAASVESMEGQLTKIRSRSEEISKKLYEIEAQVSRVADKLSQAEVSLSEAQGKLSSVQQELQTSYDSLEQKQKSKENAIAVLADHESRLKSLKALAAAREGLDSGPKAVMQWSTDPSQQVGEFQVLPDLLEIDPQFQTALSSWLGPRMDHLFGRSLGQALNVFELLKSQKQGEVSVWLSSPDSNTGSELDEEMSRNYLEGLGIRVLSNLKVETKFSSEIESKASKTIESMLSRVWLVENLDELRTESFNFESLRGWSLAALDGTVLDANGMLRGGTTQVDETANILARKNAIQELESQVANSKEEKETLDREILSLEESILAQEEQVESLQGSVQSLQLETNSLSKERDQLASQNQEVTAQREQSSQEEQQVRAEADRLGVEHTQVKERLEYLEKDRVELESSLGERDTNLSSREERLRSEEGELQALRLKEVSYRERIESSEREFDSAQSLITDREKRFQELSDLLSRIEAEKNEHVGGDSAIETRIAELTRSKSESESQLTDKKTGLDETRTRLQELNDTTKASREAQDSKSSRLNEMAIEAERVSADLDHLVQNIEEKYGAGCLEKLDQPEQQEMPDPIVTEEISEEEERELAEEVDKLRERIRRLGEVNPMAVEEFDREKVRHEDLTAQREDLEKSIQDLQDAIDHINKTSEERFRKAFEAISKRFEKLFPIIFGGGKAELSLVYPEGSNDILEAGIDVLAQPPGKKIVNITLLSGGEKALTAVSFIFAIFMVKPSPFCLLDEVDAPLDDTNIGKFNALLKEMSAKTQFILITHNKKTMELNDTLYGVTMEDPGVSKMVSIEMQ